MTPDDANKLLALAKANYSYAFKTMTKQEKIMLVQSWAFALQDIPADIVMLAFMQLLSTSKWLPTAEAAQSGIDNLSIGGTNLVLNSDASLSSGESKSKIFKLVSQEDLTKYRGQRATLSIQVDADEVYSDPSESGVRRFAVEIGFNNADGSNGRGHI